MLVAQKINTKTILKGIRYFYSHYDALGVQMGATQQQIKSKYYELAKKYHPDLANNTANSQKFIKIQEAYEILSDQQKKRQYDNLLYSSSYSSSYQKYEHPYQRQQQYSYEHQNYENFGYDARPSFMSLVRSNILTILVWCSFLYMFGKIVVYLEHKMTELDMERQNVLMMTQPGIIEQRKKLYAREIKQKNIYGQLIDLKSKGETMKSMQEKEGMLSIKGILKDGTVQGKRIILLTEEYM